MTAGFARESHKQDPKSKPPEKPALTLTATPRHGFGPLTVTLYARLEGVPQGEKRFCHAGIEWTGEARGERIMRSTEDSRCLHPPDETRVEHSWTKTLELHDEGIYRYQVTLHLKDGGTVQSNTVDVRVVSTY